MLKGKWYSAINILSLTIGLTIALLSYVFIDNELSYDQFNDRYEDIYRFTNIVSQNNQEQFRAGITYPSAEVLAVEFPAIEKVARIRHHEDYMGLPLIRYAGKSFLEKEFYWVDQSLFDIFSFRFIEGSPETAFPNLRSLVISRETAEKYFGDEPALGKEVTMSADLDITVNGRKSEDYTMVISGVVNIPENSSVHFELAGNMLFSTFEHRGSKTNWFQATFPTYILLSEGANAADLQSQLPAYVQKYFDKDIKAHISLQLQPLEEVHLGNLPGQNKTSSLKQVVNVVRIIAICILMLSCINFVNLSTARFSQRAREVGVRKVIGAGRYQLTIQFLLESLILALMALIGACVIIQLVLPVFNALMNRSLVIGFDLSFWLPALLLTIGIGLCAGIYPALFLASFEAKEVIKGQLNSGFKGRLLRRALVVSQFVITVILLIGVSIVSLQNNYLKNADLSIARDQYVVIRLKEGVYIDQNKFSSFKNELLEDASISTVTGTWSVPFGVNVPVFNYPFRVEGFSDQERARMHLIRADEDFIDAFDVEILQGRKLSLDYATDLAEGFVINEKAAALLGFSSPLGKQLEVFSGGGNSFKQGQIVGVMKDMNFLSLHREVEPLVISMASTDRYRYMVVRFDTRRTESMLSHVNASWKKLEPNWPVELFFLDDEWKMHYENEEKLGSIVKYLTVIALLIACLGLFALSGFSFERRKREMSIRKVLGASVNSIYQLLSVDFIKLITLSLIIATPVGWFFAHRWLDGFAYHINMNVWIALGVASVLLVTTLGTVSYHTLRSARINPVDSLKTE